MNTTADDGSLAGVRRWAMGLALAAAGTLLASWWMIFFYAPTEREMGVVQRIFYVHVPSAWVAFMAFGIVALCSLGYLWLKDERLDAIAVASAELGVIFTSIVLLTGPLWGKIAWGAWWVWDARLTLTLLLWFIYVGYFMVRGATESPERGKRFAAIVGVVGAVDIPLIHMSVQWFRSQHPKPVIMKPEGPSAAPEIVQTLLLSLLAFTLLFFALMLARYLVMRLQQRVDAVRPAAGF
jgi:heme exporter protein C